jgi:hypothetical protein
MCHIIGKKRNRRKLLLFLNDTEFIYTLHMDGNRAEDGISLRYRFGYECDIEEPVIACYLDDRPCSTLEMMVALCVRCEEHIIGNPEIGDRTGQWFWGMVDNLGFGNMDDDHFDVSVANDILQRFFNHEYDRDGKGGLVTVRHSQYDLRSVEIWYQMMWYLDEFLGI